MDEIIRGKPTDGIVSRYINRRISSRITKFIVSRNINVTPNQISILSAFIGFLTLPLYIFRIPIIAGILVELSSIIDGVDGELARALNLSSKSGGFLDACLDRYVDFIILLGASLYLLNSIQSILAYIAIMSSIAGSILVSYIHARGEKDLGIHPSTVGFFPNIASRDVRLFILFIGSILDQMLYTLLILGIITNSYFIAKIIEVFKAGRKLDSR